MKTKFFVPKKEPNTAIESEITAGTPIETETGFLFPINALGSEGAVAIAGIKCDLRISSNEGLLTLDVKSVTFEAGVATSETSLNSFAVDLKSWATQVGLKPTNEDQVSLMKGLGLPTPPQETTATAKR